LNTECSRCGWIRGGARASATFSSARGKPVSAVVCDLIDEALRRLDVDERLQAAQGFRTRIPNLPATVAELNRELDHAYLRLRREVLSDG
jgi:hypothetical protein